MKGKGAIKNRNLFKSFAFMLSFKFYGQKNIFGFSHCSLFEKGNHNDTDLNFLKSPFKKED